MRKVRILVCLFFLASCVIYGMHAVKGKITEDKNAPVISFEEDILYVEDGATEEDFLVGVTASDEEDGELTSQIQVASISRFLGEGKRTVKYIVFDSADKLGTAERTIIYENYTPPRIFLKEPLRFTKGDYEEKLETLKITASDSSDGDLTANIRRSFGEIQEVKPGNYPITFQVNNSAGDSCVVPMELSILDPASETGKYYPILKDYIVYTSVGKEVKLASYLRGIQSSEETYIFGEVGIPSNIKASNVKIQSNVDYTKTGVYAVNYTYETRAKVKATTTLYVVVEE